MRKSRFTEQQIVAMLSQFEAGASAEEIGRRHGVHANTIRMRRAKYAGMGVSDVARLKQLEHENAQMQRIIARRYPTCLRMDNGPKLRSSAITD